MDSWRNVYIKLVEAKDLKAADIGGTSDPYVVVSVDGSKKAPLRSSILKKTLTPRWNQEFIVPVPEDDPDVDIFVYDWNRVLSDQVIGKLNINIVKATADVVYYDWMPLEKKGSIKVVYRVSGVKKAVSSSPPLYSDVIPRIRVHTEYDAYYPGEKLRGAVVINRHTPKKNATISLSFYAASKVHARDGKNQIDYEHESYHIELPRMGPPSGEFPVGCTVWPFEFILPVDLFPTKHATGLFESTASNSCVFIAKMHTELGKTKECSVELKVLPVQSFRLPRIPTQLTSPESALDMDKAPAGVSSEAPKLCFFVASGPSQMWAGEPYTFHLKIQNFGKPAVGEVVAELRREVFYCGMDEKRVWRRQKGYTHHDSQVRLFAGVDSTGVLNGFPLLTGTAWEGPVTIQIPMELEPSIHASTSPLIQVSYTLKVIMRARINPNSDACLDMSGSNAVSGNELPVMVLNATTRPPVPETHQPPLDVDKGFGPIFVWRTNDEIMDPNPILAPSLRNDRPSFAGDLSALFPSSSQPSPWVNEFPKKVQLEIEEWVPGESPIFMMNSAFCEKTPHDYHLLDRKVYEAAAALSKQ